jgi:DNA replication regulator DPB11
MSIVQSIKQHRLPVFSNVILSLSGINDITRRTQIHKLVTQHQGVYVKNLEPPVKVTHLLCSGDEETDKMRYAEKFNKRGEANIHVVWEEWFWDSLEFGGECKVPGPCLCICLLDLCTLRKIRGGKVSSGSSQTRT